MKIKFRGMKRKIEFLKFNEVIDDNCFYSMSLVYWKNRPMTEKDYLKMCEENINSVHEWYNSSYTVDDNECVCDDHSSRIYIRVV